MIKNNLSKIMGIKQIYMAQLARVSGVSRNAIWKLYHEKSRHLSFETIDKLCDALGVSVGELFEHIPKKK